MEVYDPNEPACALGLPAESRCRLCEAAWSASVVEGPASRGITARGTGHCPCCGHALVDEEVEAHACCMCGSRAKTDTTCAPLDLRERATFERALRRLAGEEGEDDVHTFVVSNFMGLTLEDVHARVSRGERVETGFDVLFSLFNRGAASATRATTSAAPARKKSPAASVSGPRPATRAAYEPRAMLLALVSVLVADGSEDPRETDFVNRFLANEGLDPLRPEELRVHRPAEVAARIPPHRRAEVVELMTQLACIDGDADQSEMRLVESYATAWGIPEEDIAAWVERYRARYATDAQRFLRRLKAFFVAPREHEHHPTEAPAGARRTP